MKICHCSIVHKLDDSRIFYKECVSLSKAGFNVTLFANSCANKKFEEKSHLGVNLQVLICKNRLFKHIYLFSAILRQQMKVVHFHDPELIVMGLFLRLFGKKVIYDVHENVRQDILHKIWIRKSCRILLSKVAVLLEYMASIFFNGIVAATPIIANNFSNKNTFFIRNFPPLRKQEKYVESNDKKNIIIYIGTLSEARGIKQLIAASEYLEGVAELWLLGGWVNHAFKSECENMIGFKNTKYLGIVSHEDVNKILSKASVGLCTLHSIDTFKDSYPIKVFEYMQNGLPVLMSNFPMWQELFEDSVEYADPLNPIQIAKKIKLMLGNPTRLREMSAKGRILITEKFNWDLESRKLLDLYSRILNQC